MVVLVMKTQCWRRKSAKIRFLWFKILFLVHISVAYQAGLPGNPDASTTQTACIGTVIFLDPPVVAHAKVFANKVCHLIFLIFLDAYNFIAFLFFHCFLTQSFNALLRLWECGWSLQIQLEPRRILLIRRLLCWWERYN